MNIRFPIVALVLLLCSVQAGAEKVVIGDASGKISAAIRLRKTTPSSVAWALGLFSLNDLKSGNTSMWTGDRKRSESNSPSSPKIPLAASQEPNPSGLPGIDLVVPCDREGVLVVYGQRAAVNDLKARVAQMDVPRKQVQMRVEFWTFGADEGKKLDISEVAQSAIDGTRLHAFKESLQELHAEMISSPILTTLGGVPGEISATSGASLLYVCALPRVNTDGTITTAIQLGCKESNSERTQELFTQRRTSSGETLVLGGFIDNNKRELLILLTQSIAD